MCAQDGMCLRLVTFEPADVARPFDDSELEPEADAEEGDLLLASPFDGEHHTLCAPRSKTAGDEDTALRAS